MPFPSAAIVADQHTYKTGQIIGDHAHPHSGKPEVQDIDAQTGETDSYSPHGNKGEKEGDFPG